MPLTEPMLPVAKLLIATSALLLAAIAVPVQAEAPEVPLAESQECAPPCGYIYPFIGLTPQLPLPISSLELGALPESTPVDVRFWWDFEQEGTGLVDKTDMKITFAIVKEPAWLDAALDTYECSFTLIPAVHEYDVCTLTMTFTVIGPLPMTEEELEDQTKRIMVFATSEDSGTFKRSYGVKDMRIEWEGPPKGEVVADDATEEAATIAPLVATIGLVTLAAAARRRR